ncbi:hypothetical protein LTR37_017832 [Vermiconidia calcicola]|uniref:Uncharacterized protein n=1 Tax=Vermiconidia calcicola TaxID=1690605 RepID=A0ACC3MLM5_9PEZI|nr:hypothetical protein LTR37_017832 [Vermiconidia calcicola]
MATTDIAGVREQIFGNALVLYGEKGGLKAYRSPFGVEMLVPVADNFNVTIAAIFDDNDETRVKAYQAILVASEGSGKAETLLKGSEVYSTFKKGPILALQEILLRTMMLLSQFHGKSVGEIGKEVLGM